MSRRRRSQRIAPIAALAVTLAGGAGVGMLAGNFATGGMQRPPPPAAPRPKQPTAEERAEKNARQLSTDPGIYGNGAYLDAALDAD
jgi:hypothetical protein